MSSKFSYSAILSILMFLPVYRKHHLPPICMFLGSR